MRARERSVVIAALALLGAVSCAKKKSASSPPAESAALADAGAASRDELVEAELRIAENAAQLRALGLALADAPVAGMPAAEENRRKDAEKAEKKEQGRDEDDGGSTRKSPEPAPTVEPSVTERPTTPSPKRPTANAPKDEPPPPPPPPTGAGSKSSQAQGDDRCSQICALAEVACGLEQQVCRLAEHHVGEARYEDACWRARDQCEVGSDACDDCSAC